MPASVLQETGIAATATATTIGVAFANNCTPGSAFHGAASCDTSGSATVSGFSDSVNGAWSKFEDINEPGNAQRLAHGAFVNNASAGKPTVTATFSISAINRGVWIRELGGVATTAVDTHTGQLQQSVGTGTDALSSGTSANSVQPAIMSVFTFTSSSPAVVASPGTGFSAGSGGWDNIYGSSGSHKIFTEQEPLTTTTAKAGTFTSNVSGSNWVTLMAVFDQLPAASTYFLSGDEYH